MDVMFSRPATLFGPAVVRAARRTQLSRSFSLTVRRSVEVDGKEYPSDSWTNVTSPILKHCGRHLHLQKNHPLSITRQLVESKFPDFIHHNTLPPVVTVDQNFDSLGFAPDHPGRSSTDTYYVNQSTVLRTHTTAHEVDVFRANLSNGYTIAADVYRRDSVDKSHYPVFHQMEGALTWDRNQFPSGSIADQINAEIKELLANRRGQDLPTEDPNPTFQASNPRQEAYHSEAEVEAVATHLKRSLEDVFIKLFTEADRALVASGQASEETREPLQVRWVEAFFPHTSPSWELEIWWRGQWLEVLGCGVIDQKLLNRAGVDSRIGWAFGIGLERIAMLLFGIPDIRLFWSKDSRFLNQFDETKPIKRFQSFSKHPAAPRDVAFWLPAKDAPVITDIPSSNSSTPSPAGGQMTEPVQTSDPAFHENDLMEIVRNIAGDSVEDVSLVDEFKHPKTGRRSLCYRVIYRSLEKTLTNDEANAMHEQVRQQLVARFDVELR